MPKKEKEEQAFDFLPFDFGRIHDDGLNVLLGQRDSGKTMFATYMSLMSTHAHTGQFMVITDSIKVKNGWSKFIHPMFIRDPSLELLRNVKKIQNDLILKYSKAGKEFPPELHLTIIIDDCGDNPEFMRSREIREFAVKARHWETDMTIIIQEITFIDPKVRDQVCYYFVMSILNAKTIQMFVDNHVKTAKKDQLAHLVDAFTLNHSVLVISCCHNPRTITDACFHTRIPESKLKPIVNKKGKTIFVFKEEIMLGGKYFLQFAKGHCNDESKIVKQQEEVEVEQVKEEEEIEEDFASEVDSELEIVKKEYVYEDRLKRLIIRAVQAPNIPKIKKKLD